MGQSNTKETPEEYFINFRKKLSSVKFPNGNGQHKSIIDHKANGAASRYLKTDEVPDPVLYIQEQERKRIAEALHNDLGQLLYSIHLNLSKIENSQLSEEVIQIKEKVEELVLEAISATRRITHELTPCLLKDFGLKAAIEELCRRSITKSLNIKAFIELDRRMDDLTETSVYRIVQELLNNIVKHSQATEAKVLLTENSHTLYIRVEDNGKGFLNDKKKADGLGLHYIQNRIQQLHGEWNLYSAPDKGTVAQIKFLMP